MISKSENGAGNELEEYKIGLIIILKDFKKQLVIVQSQTFFSFSFLIDCCMTVFSLVLSKSY